MINAVKWRLQQAFSLVHPSLIVFFIACFFLIYTIFPAALYQSIFPDSAQNIAWGHAWLWSYNRHPPLGTWLITLANNILHCNELSSFVSSALCLSISLWFIYKLTKHYMSAQDALFSCVLSTFSLYYLINFVLQFNQNTILLPCWVMTCYFFDQCMRFNKVKDWLLLAVVTAAALLAKYESVIILFVLLLYLTFHFHPKFIPNLLIGFILFLALLSPHIISVLNHGALTFAFIHMKMNVDQNHSFWYLHFSYPSQALFGQLCHILPAIILLIVFIKAKQVTLVKTLEKHQFNYLVYLGLAPLILVVCISSIFGLKIQAEWGYPLFSFTIPAIMSYFKLTVKNKNLAIIIVMALLAHLVILFTYFSITYFSSARTRINFPSYSLANYAEQYWHRFTSKPIKYVGGDEVIDYFLAAYLPSKPLLLENYSLIESPWIKKEKLKENGILFVVEGCIPAKNKKIQEQFSIVASECIELPLSNKYRAKNYAVTLMVVPPAGDIRSNF